MDSIYLHKLLCNHYSGSDIGGSTRMPAFFNGLYALNPTPGHTSLKGIVVEKTDRQIKLLSYLLY